MKLTNDMRLAFVNAVMADVPSVDYDEQAAKIFKQAVLAAMPPKVRELTRDAKCAEYLETTYHYLPSPLSSVVTFAINGAGYRNKEVFDRLPAATRAELEKLAKLKREQSDRDNSLRARLHALAGSATTRVALLKLLPEFEKYLPLDEADACRTLPVANVVADFVKAGWPKKYKPASTKTAAGGRAP